MSNPTCPTCAGCRVASLRWAGGDRWIAEPCPDCRPPDASAGYDRIAFLDQRWIIARIPVQAVRYTRPVDRSVQTRPDGGIVSGVDIRPDPRLSNLRPAWLPDTGWSDRLCAMADDDLAWIETQWQLAGGGTAQADTSRILALFGDDSVVWPILILLVAAVVCFGVPMLITASSQ